MFRICIIWGLFIIVTVYLVKELFSKNKENIDTQEDESETEEDKKLAEIALNAKPIDDLPPTDNQKLLSAGEHPKPYKKLVRIFMATSQVQSRMIEMKLGDAGIEAVIEPLGAGIFPLDSAASCEEAILVDEKDVAAAQQIIIEHIAEEKKQSKKTQTIPSPKPKKNL